MSQTKPKLFFYVQHLLGIGHVQRASAIVRACLDEGMQVTVASGGVPLPWLAFSGAKLVQLPPVKSADATFSGLVDATGQEIDERFKENRTKLLFDAFKQSQADILLIESYPFARRQLRWELKPLLEMVTSQYPETLVVSSIRDILQKRRYKRELESQELTDEYFDAVFVHGDERFIPLSESYSLTEQMRDKLVYTGFVSKSKQPGDGSGLQAGHGEVIVSSGGGAIGFAMMDLVLNTRRSGYLSDRTWRFLLGPNMLPEDQQRLKSGAPEGCYFEPARTDFPDLLRNCYLSISQGGYNTVMDILLAECPSLLIPFEKGEESEQAQRAGKLASIGRCAQLLERDLSVENCIKACEHARTLQTCIPQGVAVNGAEKTAQLLLEQWLKKNG